MVLVLLCQGDAECQNNESMIVPLRFVSRMVNKLLRVVERRVLYWPVLSKPSTLYCARNGYLTLMKWAFKTLKCKLEPTEFTPLTPGIYYNVVTEAARSGHLGVVKWAVKHGCSIDTDSVAISAAAGPVNRSFHRLEVLDWMEKKYGGPEEFSYFDEALYSQSYAVVKWALNKKKKTPSEYTELCTIFRRFLTTWATEGRLDMLKLALKHDCFTWSYDLIKATTLLGQTKVLKWVFDLDRQYGFPAKRMLLWAAESGCMTTFSWVCANRDRFDVGLYKERNPSAHAALGGNLEILKQTVALGYPLTTEVMVKACSSGNLEMVQWARHNGCPWDEFAMLGALRGSKNFDFLPIIKWMRSNGWEWTWETELSAAHAFSYETYAWIRDNGCSSLESAQVRDSIAASALENPNFWEF